MDFNFIFDLLADTEANQKHFRHNLASNKNCFVYLVNSLINLTIQNIILGSYIIELFPNVIPTSKTQEVVGSDQYEKMLQPVDLFLTWQL